MEEKILQAKKEPPHKHCAAAPFCLSLYNVRALAPVSYTHLFLREHLGWQDVPGRHHPRCPAWGSGA